MSASSHKSAKARHKRPTPNRARQGMAVTVTGVVSAGVVLGGASAAGAAAKPVSQGQGFFLSGTALGTDLDDLVKLKRATAVNDGSPATVSDLNPLSATLLNSLDVPLGPVNLLKGNGLLTLGAVNQAAIARSNGSAIAASGAITNSGAIAVGGKNGVPASNATLDLGGLLASNLGTSLVGGLADLDLEIGAIAASAKQAKGENGTQSGDYRIAQLKLKLQSPLLAGVLGTLGLGDLQTTVNDLVASLNGVAGLGALGVVDITGEGGLLNLLSSVDTTLGTGGPVQVDLTTGTVTVDVEELLKSLGLDLNNLPPNTEIVNLILNALDGRVVDLVIDELDKLVQTITTAVANVGVNVTAPLPPPLNVAVPIPAPIQTLIDGVLSGTLSDLLRPVTGTQSSLLGPGSDLLDPLFNALDDVLSLRVNVQSKSGGKFTERALRVSVLPASDLLTVNLASATVGPGAGLVQGADEEEADGLPATGGTGSGELAAVGLAMVLAGAAATAGSRLGGGAAPSTTRGRSRGRHARR